MIEPIIKDSSANVEKAFINFFFFFYFLSFFFYYLNFFFFLLYRMTMNNINFFSYQYLSNQWNIAQNCGKGALIIHW